MCCCLRRGFGTGLGQLAAEALAGRRLVALDQLRQRGKGLPRGDVVAALPVQRLDLVVLDVVAALLVPVLDAERKAARILLRFADEESSACIGVRHQVLLGCSSANLTAEPPERIRF